VIETCEILWEQDTVDPGRYCFVARSIGTGGIYLADRSATFKGHPVYDQGYPGSSELQPLVKRLVAEGWQPLSGGRSNWFNHHFQRQADSAREQKSIMREQQYNEEAREKRRQIGLHHRDGGALIASSFVVLLLFASSIGWILAFMIFIAILVLGIAIYNKPYDPYKTLGK